MTQSKIKDQISKAIEEGDFDYLLQENVFHALISSELLEDHLHNYFSNRKHFSDVFDQRLLEDKPDLFIQFVRTHQYFLKGNRIDFLLKLSLSDDYLYHQKIWKTLQEQELQLWHVINEELKKIEKTPIEEVLIHTTLWIENSRFETPISDFIEDISHLGEVYSFFIQLYLSTYKDRIVNLDEREFYQRFLLLASRNSNPLSSILQAIGNWISYYINLLSEYCYDFDAKPECQNGMIGLAKDPKDFYRWRTDAVRYRLTKISYLLRADEEVGFRRSKNYRMLWEGGKPNEETIQYQCALKEKSSQLFLEDLHITKLVLGNQDITIAPIHTALSKYSNRLFCAYEHPIDSLKGKTKTWLEAYNQVVIQSYEEGIKIDPWVLFNNNSSEQKIDELKDIPFTVTKEILGLFTFKVNKKHLFDRFDTKHKYDVWEKPFVRMGKMLFCPTAFLANNDWFYGFAQASLKNISSKWAVRVRKPSAEEMEKSLTEMFKQKGFEPKWFDDKTAGDVDGDVDVIVEDEQHTLYMQLKRTKYRLKLKDQYNEDILIDKKAIQQLNDAEQFFSNENEIFNPKHQPLKWTLTTSFEGIGKVEKGCRKVNYFDLLRLLCSPAVSTLGDIIKVIEEDGVLQEWKSHWNDQNLHPWLRDQIQQAGFPVPIAEASQLFKPIICEGEKVIEHAKKYGLALDFDREGKKQKAIQLFKDCLNTYPNALDTHGALANTYADLGDFENAYEHFEETLKLVPFDPFVTRNYVMALYQGGRYFDGLKIALELYKKYPLLEQLEELFTGYMMQFIIENNLSEQEVRKLCKSFDI